MCFTDDGNGPDIWLSIENGRCVPAPPLIHIPGQRQMQKRLEHKARRDQVLLSHASEGVKTSTASKRPSISYPYAIPASLITPVNNQQSATKQSSMPTPTQTSDVPVLTGQHLHITTLISDSGSAQGPRLPEPIPGKPAAQPAAPPIALSSEEQPTKQLGTAMCAKGAASDAAGLTKSFVSNNVPSSSPASTASSLRSILKKPPSLRPEDSVSNVGAPASTRDAPKHRQEKSEPVKSKKGKSVSFLGKAGLLEPGSVDGTLNQLGAAEQGAAIAKQLVEKEKRSQKGEKGLKSAGDMGRHDFSERSVDLRLSRQSTQTGGSVCKGRKAMDGGIRHAIWKDIGIWDNKATASVKDMSKLAYKLASDDENDSDIDDAMSASWP